MATIKLTVEGTNLGIVSVTTTLDAKGSARFTAYLKATYGLKEDGTPRTFDEIVREYWAGMVAGTLSNVERFDQEQAKEAAVAAVMPVVATTI